MNKKTLYILGIIALAIFIGVLVYLFFFRSNTSITKNPNGQPFGEGGTDINYQNNQNPAGETGGNPSSNSVLWKITNDQVSGAEAFVVASSTLIRFIDKTTGNVFSSDISQKSTSRVTNTTLPKTDEVVWKNENSFVARTFKDGGIQSLFADIVSAGTSTDSFAKLETSNLLKNISQFVFSPKQNQSFFISVIGSRLVGFLAGASGEKPITIWSFPTTEWTAQWPAENTITLTTKASAEVDGYLYFLNIKSREFYRILKGKGLTTLTDPTANLIIYSTSQDQTLRLHNIKDNTDIGIGLKTLPEKCVFGKKDSSVLYCGIPKNQLVGEYPDLWYRGQFNFSDKLVRINLRDGVTEEIVDLGSDVDVYGPTISPNDAVLVFRSKKDLSLWAVLLPKEPFKKYTD